MKLNKRIKIQPFQKLCWTSQKYKNLYEKVIREISNKIQDAEIESVAQDQRLCSWQTRRLKSLPEFTKQCLKKDMIVFPVKLVGSWGSGFIHYTPAVRHDDPNPNVYCIISKSKKKCLEFEKAHNEGDHIMQGDLLGFPRCCSEFFTKEWKKGYFDPMYQVAHNTFFEDGGHHHTTVTGKISKLEIKKWHPYSNPLLRYIGLRVGFHIPCSLYCKETIKIATERLKLIKDKELVKVLQFLLSEPLKWEAHKGILEIKTKYFYVLTQTVPCVDKYVVELVGE